ncbi:MAG: HNH endonuclease, partial [Actinomycetota bacterium]|nr:HNH endonuclease [Actinomycetota bacterium]
AEEARARAKARMWMRPDGDGSTHGGFCIPDAQAEMLQTALNALLSPRRRTDGLANGAESTTVAAGVDPDLAGRRLPYEQRLGLALCELIEHLPLDKLPQAGRSTPGVVVEIDYQTLLTGLGAATLSSGGRISASEVRRLACNSGLLPMVFSGESVVLDLGRSERLFSWHQRIALGKTQGGCVADGCDRPPAWCEAHHCVAWSDGGRTDLANGVLLCGRHHHLVHSGGWVVEVADDGVPELVPPARVDPLRRPVRHRRFRLRARE